MPGPNAWTAIPTTLLDLGQKTQDAEAWAAGQRAQLAETWANAQRQAVQTMADTWQRGNDTQDHYQSGYQGAQDGATGPTGPLGYNDMAGASSSPGMPAFGANPEDVTSPIDQARNVVGASPSPSPFTSDWPSVTVPSANPAPQPLPQLLGGDQPLTDLGNQIVQGQIGRMADLDYRSHPTIGTRADQPAREQVNRPYNPVDIQSGMTPSQLTAQAKAGADMALGTISGVPEGAEALAGKGVTRFFHGTGSSFGVPDATHFDPNGLFGPGYYLTSDARVAGSYADTRAIMPTQVEVSRSKLTNQITSFQDALSDPAYSRLQKQEWTNETIPALQKELDALPAPVGPNVRAVNVPNDLKLLDADKPSPPGTWPAVLNAIGETRAASVVRPSETYTYEEMLHRLSGGIPNADSASLLNRGLQGAGFDGIRYNGGQRIPMTDATGNPIEHTALMIFPDSMGKLTNAISGTRFGSPPAVGGAIVGGLAGATQPAQNDQERARNIALGAVGGGVGGHLVGSGQLGRLAGEESGAIGKLPKAATATPGEQRAGNILLRKFVDPEVQQVIADAAAKDPQAMEAARRGVVSDATVQDLADAAGTSVPKIVARWKPGDIANAETITAMRSALQNKAQEVSDLAKTAVATPSTANDLSLALAVHEQNAIQAAVSGGTAELGRGLRALRATVQDAVQSGDPEKMQAILKRMGGSEWTADLAKKLSQIAPEDAQARYDFLRNAMKPTLKNDLTFLWYNAMLSGPHTVAVKTMSEILSLASSPFERAAAAAVDIPLSAMRGGGRQRFFGEAPADVVGMVGGIREGVGKALYTMKNGYSMSDVLNSDYIRPRTSFSPGVERVLGSPSRILAAGVDMMSSIAEAGAIHAGAYRQASLEGLKGTALAERMAELRANPTKSLASYANDQGIYRTFQTEPVRGSVMQRIGDIRSAEWHGIPVARIIVPFWQTPINLMKQGLERSPMGLFNPAMIKEIIAKDPKAADSLGRALLGSGVATAIALQVGAGNITGPAPTNPTEADAWRRQGKTAWSIRIGDKYVNYQKIPYIAQSLGQVASIVDSINKGQDVGSAAGQLAATIGANMTTEPYMQGISTLMNALSNPTQFGDRMVSGLATSVIPAGVRVIAQNVDPTVRQTSTVPEAMQADIPGLSQSLPPRLDAFGQPRSRLTSDISPIGVSQATNDPVDAELTKYGVEPGFTGKTMRGIDLTREENAAHQRLAGQLVKQNLTKLVNAPGYQQLSDTAKARALTLAISHAKDAAANQYLAQLIQQQGKAAIVGRIQQKKLQRLPKAG